MNVIDFPCPTRKALLRMQADIVRKIHRLRALESGLISPDRNARPTCWLEECVLSEDNPLMLWELIECEVLRLTLENFGTWDIRDDFTGEVISRHGSRNDAEEAHGRMDYASFQDSTVHLYVAGKPDPAYVNYRRPALKHL